MRRRIGPSGPFTTDSVSNLASLAGAGARRFGAGDVVWVEKLRRPFVKDDAGGVAVPGQVVACADGSGVWRSLGSFSGEAGAWRTQTDWHIDAVNGSVEGDGSAAHPIDSWRELLARLGGQQLSAGTTISLHSNLTEQLQLAPLVPDPTTSLVVTAEPAATTVATGTVTSYTAESLVAPGESPLLRSTDLGDWTPFASMRVRFIDGNAAGAMTWVAKAAPGVHGVDYARVPRPMRPAYPFPADSTPSVGSTFVVESLATVDSLVLSAETARYVTILRGIQGPQPVGSDANQAIGGGRAILQGCAIGDAVFAAHYLRFQACRLGTPGGSSCLYRSGMYDFNGCLLFKSYSDRWGSLRLNDCVFQGGAIVWSSFWVMAHCGAYDSTSSGVSVAAAGASLQLGSGGLYGFGNAQFGIDVQGPGCMVGYSSAKPVITGNLNNFSLAGVAHAWVDAPLTDATWLSAIQNH